MLNFFNQYLIRLGAHSNLFAADLTVTLSFMIYYTFKPIPLLFSHYRSTSSTADFSLCCFSLLKCLKNVICRTFASSFSHKVVDSERSLLMRMRYLELDDAISKHFLFSCHNSYLFIFTSKNTCFSYSILA
jgi:hypothetical protein